MHLQSTDYGKLLSSAEQDLTVSLVDRKLRESLTVEFSCLRSSALPQLSTFMDYITYATAFKGVAWGMRYQLVAITSVIQRTVPTHTQFREADRTTLGTA